MVCLFDTELGRMAVVLVGAMIVAGIETVATGKVKPSGRLEVNQHNLFLEKGAELGRFYLGSTAVVLFEKDKPKQEILDFIKEHGIEYPVTVGDENFKLAKQLGDVKKIPEMFLFTKEGRFVKKFVGKTSKESLLPFGNTISAVSPTALPNNPFAIGVFTEIFPALISDSLSGTNVNFCSCLVALFLRRTVQRIETLEVSN